MDAVRPLFNSSFDEQEIPNPETQNYYDMLNAIDNWMLPRCLTHSQLSLVFRMLNIMADHHLPQCAFDAIAQLIKKVVSEDNLFIENFYATKNLVRKLGLPVGKIPCCFNGCMNYQEEDVNLIICKIYGHPHDKRRRATESNQRRKTNVCFKKMYYIPLMP